MENGPIEISTGLIAGKGMTGRTSIRRSKAGSCAASAPRRHIWRRTPCDGAPPLPLSTAMASGAPRRFCLRASEFPSEADMVQTTNRFFDEVARLMNDAAGAAQGMRREVKTLFRNQAARILRDLDQVKSEDFE